MPPFQFPPSIRKVAWSLLTFQKAWLGFLSRLLLPKLRLVVGSNLSFLCTSYLFDPGWENADLSTCWFSSLLQLQLSPTAWVFPFPASRGKLRDGRACWLRRCPRRRQGRLGGVQILVILIFLFTHNLCLVSPQRQIWLLIGPILLIWLTSLPKLDWNGW